MYQGPETCPFYQTHWSQYPEREGDDSPYWLIHFKKPFEEVIDNDKVEIVDICEEEEDSETSEFRSHDPYRSPPRTKADRAGPISNFNTSALKTKAAALVSGHIDEIIKCDTLRSQIVFVTDLLRPDGLEAMATFGEIGAFFGLSKGAISSHYKRGVDEGENGRPSTLTDDQINVVIDYVYQRFYDKSPVTFDGLLIFIKDEFGIDMLIKTLYSLVSRIPHLRALEGIPMETERIECPIELIEAYFSELEHILTIEKSPSMFVINIDEAGFAEWADAMKLTVIVPSDLDDESIKIPVARAGKRASLLAAICADGTTLPPAIVVPRKTVETELLDCGYTPDKVCMGYQESGFFTTEHFLNWAFNYFFPAIRKRREEYNYHGECLLIIDGFGPHENDDFLTGCTEEGIIPLQLAPHSSDQTQPLDIGIFGVQKAKMARMSTPSGLSPQTSQLIRIIDSFAQTATISNVISAFKGAGIVSTFDAESGYLFPKVDRSFATKVRHWELAPPKVVFNKKRIVIGEK